MNGNNIIYEQPLNELVRAGLRLEHLFKQIDTCLFSFDVEQHAHTIIRILVDILNILDRPDLKAKLSKEFSRIQAYFTRLKSIPDISHEKLDDTLKKINRLTEYFTESHGKIAQNLRDNDFLAIIRQNLLSPGGGSSVDTPGYYYWLNQPSEIRQQQIHTWLNEFTEIRSATELLLSIIRNSSEPKQIVADHGFYHESLDPQLPIQLTRVVLSRDINLYPEISVGKHRLSIRFVIPSIATRPIQSSDNVRFKLVACIV